MGDLIIFLKKYIYAAGSCLYLFTVGILVARNRPLVSRICTHFGFPMALKIPEISLAAAAPDGLAVAVHEPAVAVGNVSLLELLVLNRLVKYYNPGSIFEFGTFNGRTTLNLAANSGPDAKVFTLDLPKTGLDDTKLPLVPAEKDLIDKDTIGELYRGTEWEPKIVQLTGDSAAFDYSQHNGKMDFVFVDGSHSYEYVINDSRQASRLLRDGCGVIVWHDYGIEGWQGVVRALEELYLEGGVFAGLRHIAGTTLVVLKK